MSRLLPLIAFFVVFLGSFAPRFAHASCGDWLQHASPIQTFAPSTGEDSTDAGAPAAPTRPCSGPLCRQSPSGPDPQPASPTIERRHHDAAWIRLGTADNGSLDHEWFVADGLFLLPGHKMGIERPPRS